VAQEVVYIVERGAFSDAWGAASAARRATTLADPKSVILEVSNTIEGPI